MGVINLDYEMVEVAGGHKHLSLPLSAFRSFDAGTLGLGDISKQGEHIDALAAILDLENFTLFCSQIDPYLVVPSYLDQLLTWTFNQIAERFTQQRTPDRVILWGKFPFYAKFLGDGILFLWDTKGLGPASLGNIVINLYRVGVAYQTDFLPAARREFPGVPAKLRCGIARGQVVAIGGGRDFVGPCVNLASRLQKVSQLSFAFSRKGMDPSKCFGETWQKEFVPKRIMVRGMEHEEIIMVCRKEFDALPPDEKALFKDVG